eukprot:3331519-Pyramimonas_sp.AAC.1
MGSLGLRTNGFVGDARQVVASCSRYGPGGGPGGARLMLRAEWKPVPTRGEPIQDFIAFGKRSIGAKRPPRGSKTPQN